MDILNRAMDAWRETERPVELSETGRSAIVAAVWRETTEGTATWEPSLRPARWLALVGLAPVALVVVAAFMVGPDTSTARIATAEKVGEDVVFTIANGDRPHTVVRSTDPAAFNPKASLPVDDGRVCDRTNSGPIIVFYRLD